MINDWKNLGTIGSGGQAEVFRVSGKEREGEYALKRFKNDLRERRNLSEILIMKTLWSLGMKVPEIIEDGEYKPGRPYFICKYYDQGSLRKKLQNSGEDIRGRDFLMKLCISIRDINKARYAHRDLKPENILIEHPCEPIVCDYGLGRNLESDASITPEGEPIGSVHYMHRLAFDIKRIDPGLQVALDAYSFGKILYEIVAKEQIFGFNKAQSANEMVKQYFNDSYIAERFIRAINRLLDDDISRLNEYWQKFPDELERILFGEGFVTSVSPHLVDKLKRQVTDTLGAIAANAAVTDDDYKAIADDIYASILKNPAVDLINKMLAEQGDGRKVTIRQDTNLREILEGVGVKSNYGIEPLHSVGRRQRLVLKELYIESPIAKSNIGVSILKTSPEVQVLISEIRLKGGFIDINSEAITKISFNPSNGGDVLDIIGPINDTINSLLGG
jgi:serine/threonine protein kinase